MAKPEERTELNEQLLDMRQLQYFLCVADLENFTLAAERARVAQSALSRQIINLERRLGVDLFERVGRRVRLTAAGQLLRIRAQELAGFTRQLRQELVTQSSRPSGYVVVGSLPSLAHFLFPLVARNCHERYPNIKLRLIEALTGELQEMLVRGEIDVALFAFPEAHRVIATKFLCKEQIYLIGAPGRLAGFGKSCNFAKVKDLPLILTDHKSRERLWFERFAALHGIVLNNVVEANSLATMKNLAAFGVGYLLLPGSAIAGEESTRRWVFSAVRGAVVERVLAWRSDGPFSAAQKAVIELIEHEAGRV